MIYNLLNWLLGTPPTVRGQLRRWRKTHPFCERMNIPSGMYDTLLSELRASGVLFNYDYDPTQPVERGMVIGGVLTLPSRYVSGPKAIRR
jgi:hypothetical protein